jgi:hypothetical protein
MAVWWRGVEVWTRWKIRLRRKEMALWGKCKRCEERDKRIQVLEKENYKLLAERHLKTLTKVERKEVVRLEEEKGSSGFGSGLMVGLLMSGGREAVEVPVVEEDRSGAGEFGGAGASGSWESGSCESSSSASSSSGSSEG